MLSFLKFEWSKYSNNEADEALAYNSDNVRLVNVPIPHQENSFDCGVYILKFAEVMIRNYETLASAGDEDAIKGDGSIPRYVIDEKLEVLISSRAFSADDVARQRKHIEETIASDTTQYQLAMEQKKDQNMTTAEAQNITNEKETKAADYHEVKSTETESDENMKYAEEESKEAAVGNKTDDEEQQALEPALEHSKPHTKALDSISRENEDADIEDDQPGYEKEVSEAETEVVDLDDDEDEEDVILTIEVEGPPKDANIQAEDIQVDHKNDDVEC